MTARLRLNEGNRRWWTLVAMCFALFMIMLDNTVVNVALPSIQRDLNADLSSLEWTINAYTLSFAVLLVTGGRLGDIFGRRRMFLAGVVIFAASSAAIGLSPTDSWLVAGRAVQGVGAALMMPATLSIITNAFPAHERGKAIGTWAGVSALALAIGPVLGGFLTESVSWRAIFFLNLPVAVGAVAVTLFAARESRDETVEKRVDIPGIVAITAGLTALVLALVEGNQWGWGSTRILGLLALAVVALTAFVVIEMRTRVPMVDFAFFRSRTFLGANVVAFVVSFAMLAMFFFLALYMQNILGYSPLQAGVRFLPSTIVIMFIAPVAGRLTDRIGPRPLIVSGLHARRGLAAVAVPAPRSTRATASCFRAFVAMGVGVGLDDVADEHRGDERRGPDQGGRRLRHALDEPHGRRDLRRRRPRRAGGRARALQARAAAPGDPVRRARSPGRRSRLQREGPDQPDRGRRHARGVRARAPLRTAARRRRGAVRRPGRPGHARWRARPRRARAPRRRCRRRHAGGRRGRGASCVRAA